VHTESITHSYPHCWRCKNPVIFRATEQWFISMDSGVILSEAKDPEASGTGSFAVSAAQDDTRSLRARALDEIRKVKWYPGWAEDRIAGMVQTRPDWCISRQRLWGVPITVLYCESCNEPIT